MSECFVVDTNVAIALLSDEPEAVHCWDRAGEVVLPAPVLAELLFGARKSVRPQANERRVRALAQRMSFAPITAEVCDHFAAIKLELRRQGRPIPVNDMWIAAVCRAAGGRLASRDTHFDGVTDLARDDWRS